MRLHPISGLVGPEEELVGSYSERWYTYLSPLPCAAVRFIVDTQPEGPRGQYVRTGLASRRPE